MREEIDQTDINHPAMEVVQLGRFHFEVHELDGHIYHYYKDPVYSRVFHVFKFPFDDNLHPELIAAFNLKR